MNYFTHKEFVKRHGNCGGATFIDENGEVSIAVPYHAKRHTKLHEIGHLRLGHLSHKSSDKWEERFKEECEADWFAYKCLNKKADIYVFGSGVEQSICKWVGRNSHYTTKIFNECLKFAKEIGYNMSNEERSVEWNCIKDWLKEKE